MQAGVGNCYAQERLSTQAAAVAATCNVCEVADFEASLQHAVLLPHASLQAGRQAGRQAGLSTRKPPYVWFQGGAEGRAAWLPRTVLMSSCRAL